jgi:alpha-tubulin suppressor-like RCC1 family protein
MVSAGNVHTAAIRSDNLLFAWGGNTSSGRHGARTGFLGDNTSDSKSSPVQVGSMQWTSVSAGFGHTMGISAEIELLPI